MTWMRLDDQFHRNPKALKMSDAAHRIYVDTLSYCSDTKVLTGFLSGPEAEAFVRGRRKPLTVIRELVQLGAWEAGADGYLIHDFEDYVPPRSKQSVLDWRATKRAEWKAIGFQSPIDCRLDADRLPITSGVTRSPVPVARSPLPVGSTEPPYPPVENYGLLKPFGIPGVSMHVDGLTPLSETLKTRYLQSMPHKEANG